MGEPNDSNDTRIEVLQSLGVDVTQIDLSDPDAAIDALWDGTKRKLAAEIRFMGQLAGVDDTGTYNPDAEEVKKARNLVIEAFRDFFVADAREELERLEKQAMQQRADLLRRYPQHTYYINQVFPELVQYGVDTPSVLSFDYPSFTQAGSGAGLGFVDGLIENPPPIGTLGQTLTAAEFAAAEADMDNFLGGLRNLAQTIYDREQMDEALFEQQVRNIVDIFVSAWIALKQTYDEFVALLEEGQYLFAMHYLASMSVSTVPAAVLTLIALAIIGAAGVGAVLGVSRIVFQGVVRASITIAPSGRQLRNAVASATIMITVTRATRSPLPGGFQLENRLGRITIDTDNLPPQERKLVETTEGSVGSRLEGDPPVDRSPANAEADLGRARNDTGRAGEEYYQQQHGGRPLQNASGHGIDNVQDYGDRIVFNEIKTSTGSDFRLRGEELRGGDYFVDRRLREMSDRKGSYGNLSQADVDYALDLLNRLDSADIEYRVIELRRNPDGSITEVRLDRSWDADMKAYLQWRARQADRNARRAERREQGAVEIPPAQGPPE